jgi:Ctf8
LEGKIVSLPKPLAVLQRVNAPLPNPHQPVGEGDSEAGDVDMREQSDDRDSGKDDSIPAAATTSYTIRTLIRKKITFSKRPTPIVGLSAKTS